MASIFFSPQKQLKKSEANKNLSLLKCIKDVVTQLEEDYLEEVNVHVQADVEKQLLGDGCDRKRSKEEDPNEYGFPPEVLRNMRHPDYASSETDLNCDVRGSKSWEDAQKLLPRCTCRFRNGIQDDCPRCRGYPPCSTTPEVLYASSKCMLHTPITSVRKWTKKINQQCCSDIGEECEFSDDDFSYCPACTQTNLALVKGIQPETKLCPYCFNIFCKDMD